MSLLEVEDIWTAVWADCRQPRRFDRGRRGRNCHDHRIERRGQVDPPEDHRRSEASKERDDPLLGTKT